eukprot:CAMPEP_0179040734 /NCGR_PEP_ID=MMETSP0796-20121207/15796_1 /TAXON_ID=73915 /ORGANISM="Pyrodinium bahamense, Strain pbaha01" /LENGTH=557 /DNA_ID=CAMNT_0020737081 /DNA_START=70 /DNA_END=1744 /DNA_ORIENTATION=-
MPAVRGSGGCLPCGALRAAVRGVRAHSVWLSRAGGGSGSSGEVLTVSRGISVQSFADSLRECVGHMEKVPAVSKGVSVQSFTSGADEPDTLRALDGTRLATPSDQHDPETGISVSSELAVVHDASLRGRPLKSLPRSPNEHMRVNAATEYRQSLSVSKSLEHPEKDHVRGLSSCTSKQHSSSTLPLPERPTLLTSKHFDRHAAIPRKLYSQPEREDPLCAGVQPKATLISPMLEDPMPAGVPTIPSLISANQYVFDIPQPECQAAFEAHAPAASQRTVSMDLFLDPAAEAAQHRTQSIVQATQPRGVAVVQAPQPGSLTSKTRNVAFLASKLAGRWMLQAGGSLVESTKSASASAAGAIAEATSVMDTTINTYLQDAWDSITRQVSTNEDSDSEDSSDDEGAMAHSAPPAQSHIAPEFAQSKKINVPAQQQSPWLARELPRAGTFGLPPAGHAEAVVGSWLASSHHASGAAFPTALQRSGPLVSPAYRPLQRVQTFTVQDTSHQLQALPRAQTFGHRNGTFNVLATPSKLTRLCRDQWGGHGRSTQASPVEELQVCR